MAGVLMDLRPLRASRQFRVLLGGLLARQFGFQLSAAALVYEVYVLTHSPAAVGLLSLVQLASSLSVSLAGGTIADTLDRRALLRTLAVLIPCCSAALAVESARPNPSVSVVIGLAGVNAALNVLDVPTRMAAMMSVISASQRVPATVLRQFVQQIARLLAPLLAGVLIALGHGRTAAVYWVDTGCALFSLLSAMRLHHLPGDREVRVGVRALRDGFGYVRRTQTVFACFVMDLSGTVLGTPTALLPLIAISHFHGGGVTYGALGAATGAGGVLGSLLSGWTRRARRLGRLVVGAICVWGGCIAMFGLAPNLTIALAALTVAGWADVVSAALRNAIIHAEVPDRLRGRMSSLQAAVVQAGPRLGSAEGAFVASLVSPEFAIVSGGFAAVASTLALARALPAFVRYTHRPPGNWQPESSGEGEPVAIG